MSGKQAGCRTSSNSSDAKQQEQSIAPSAKSLLYAHSIQYPEQLCTTVETSSVVEAAADRPTVCQSTVHFSVMRCSCLTSGVFRMSLQAKLEAKEREHFKKKGISFEGRSSASAAAVMHGLSQRVCQLLLLQGAAIRACSIYVLLLLLLYVCRPTQAGPAAAGGCPSRRGRWWQQQVADAVCQGCR